MDATSLPVTVPAAVAVLGAIGMFIKFIQTENDKVRTAHAEESKANRTVWENHLSQSIKVQAESVKVVGELVTSIKVMQNENVSSMTWAREAMQSLIREIGRSQPAKE